MEYSYARLGRRPKLTPHQQQEAIKRRDGGEETLVDIARSTMSHQSTISRSAIPSDVDGLR